ncbi:DUF6128 domain-containing protein [[Clostridium] polysaccharolyticum]|uniref:DUF6128 domain-containing protein n=1 Tax=[Clostridium] polysaccharolyticum TaxID=29364 RepID=A0A1I0ERG1_9FIRM|nr:DUF6128 domain-containing protein [[Clostridium] polysaccharolyticum]SET47941.1 hypothetical protein SAMN04487772_12410 [[Clostridium] polysaccharolyticum]
MADYKRLVSYIYDYEAGIRKRNIGFGRIESKNGQCKVTIHITANISPLEPLKVYLFRRNGSKIEGILFGTMIFKNGTGDFRGETSTNALMDTEIGLDDICGIIIVLNQNKFFGSEWDDQEIRFENFQEYSDQGERERAKRMDRMVQNIHVQTQNITDMLMEEDLANQIREPEQELKAAQLDTSAKVSEAMETVVDVVQSLFQEQKKEDGSAEPKEDYVYQEEEDIVAAQASEEVYSDKTVEAFKTQEEEVYMGGASVKEELEEEEKLKEDLGEELVAAAELSKQPFFEEPFARTFEFENQGANKESCKEEQVEAAEMGGNCCHSDNYPECVRNLFKSFPSLKPFPDSDANNWVRIEPKDIGMLPVETWVLANNSFLLHGYYNYRHLIFGVLKLEKGEQFVIGVPGILQSTEQTMAGMFGFHRFLSASKGENQYGSFGYWVQQIVL